MPSDKDFAIEFGGYLAASAEEFQRAMNEILRDVVENQELDHERLNDHWTTLSSAIHQFRRRQYRASEQPSTGIDYLKITRQILRR